MVFNITQNFVKNLKFALQFRFLKSENTIPFSLICQWNFLNIQILRVLPVLLLLLLVLKFAETPYMNEYYCIFKLLSFRIADKFVWKDTFYNFSQLFLVSNIDISYNFSKFPKKKKNSYICPFLLKFKLF